MKIYRFIIINKTKLGSRTKFTPQWSEGEYMKKIKEILIGILGFVLLSSIVFANFWVSPTDYINIGSAWTDETDAYDEDTETYADTLKTGIGNSLALTIPSALPCDRIRVFVADYKAGSFNPDLLIRIKEYDETVTTIHDGIMNWGEWIEIEFSPKSIDVIYISANNLGGGHRLRVYEADFGDPSPGYGNVGESSNFNGDVGVPSGSTYYINEIALNLADLAITDVTTNDVSTSMHGLAPKAPNDASKYLDGTGVWSVPAGGYTNLTSFVDQNAWRIFYSNSLGDVIELALGADGTYLKSTGAASAPIFSTPSGAGDVVGPATNTDNTISRWNGVDSKVLQDSLVSIDDSGSVNIPTGQTYKINGTALAVGNITGAAASGANTDITSILNTALYIGRDGDNQIKFATDNTIIFEVNNVDTLKIISTGTLDLQQNCILIDDALGTDHDYSGIIDSANVGESVVFGDLLYFDWTDVEWKKARANAVGTTPALRIALETKSNGEACLMLVRGYIRDDSAFDFGASRVFLNDDVAGTCDDTAPAESGDQIQMVGIAISADKMFFCPSIDVGEI